MFANLTICEFCECTLTQVYILEYYNSYLLCVERKRTSWLKEVSLTFSASNHAQSGCLHAVSTL